MFSGAVFISISVTIRRQNIWLSFTEASSRRDHDPTLPKLVGYSFQVFVWALQHQYLTSATRCANDILSRLKTVVASIVTVSADRQFFDSIFVFAVSIFQIVLFLNHRFLFAVRIWLANASEYSWCALAHSENIQFSTLVGVVQRCCYVFGLVGIISIFHIRTVFSFFIVFDVSNRAELIVILLLISDFNELRIWLTLYIRHWSIIGEQLPIGVVQNIIQIEIQAIINNLFLLGNIKDLIIAGGMIWCIFILYIAVNIFAYLKYKGANESVLFTLKLQNYIVSQLALFLDLSRRHVCVDADGVQIVRVVLEVLIHIYFIKLI